tara:strand:- start:24 stop:389 length:366 start_codon:yes stop_codon:yes gene_type:complete
MKYYIGLSDRTGKKDVSGKVLELVGPCSDIVGIYTNDEGETYKEQSVLSNRQLPIRLVKQILRETDQECALGVRGDGSCSFVYQDSHYSSLTDDGKLIKTDKEPDAENYSYDGSFYYYIGE